MKRRNFISLTGLGATGLASGALTSFPTISFAASASAEQNSSELSANVVIAGGGVGGCAAALSALRNGLDVIMTEETDWIGGQLTSQGVPPDEHAWIETHGAPKAYRDYRNSVRESSDGLFTTISFIFSNPPFNDKSEINELKSKLDECVSNQDFEEAAKLRDKIKELENNSSKVNDLKKELDIAIKEQNFERAIEIRDELKKIN